MRHQGLHNICCNTDTKAQTSALFRLHAASIVPELSCRELPLVGVYLVESGGFLP